VKGEIIEMVSTSKNVYDCVLPDASEIELPQDDAQQPDTEPDALLAPLEGSCLQRITGWWTYEYCYNKHIRQFHMEDSKVVNEFYLGSQKIDKEEPSRPFGDEQQQQQPLDGQLDDKYFSHFFDEGTPCDLTGIPRTTEVRYFCANMESTIISGISEHSTCNYVLMVASPLLCQHSSYQTNRELIEKIQCFPRD